MFSGVKGKGVNSVQGVANSADKIPLQGDIVRRAEKQVRKAEKQLLIINY